MSSKFHESYCLDSMQDRLFFYDDFLGDSLRDLWYITLDAGGSVAVVDAQDGGVCRFTTDGDTNDDCRLYWNNIRSLLVSKKVTMECRVKLGQTSNQRIDLAIYNAGNEIIQFNLNTAVDGNWHNYTRTAGGTTSTDSGITADTDYHVFRIECFPSGQVHFYIDGVETSNSPHTTNITANYCEPWFYIETYENAAKSMDVDYCVVRQEI